MTRLRDGMHSVVVRLALIMGLLLAACAGLLVRAAHVMPVTALVYMQFERGQGRFYIYLDPFHPLSVATTAALFRSSPYDGDARSPDGRRAIAPRVTEDGVDLFIVEGCSARRLTQLYLFPPIEHAYDDMRSNTYPLWSPAGDWIAFISSDQFATMEIYLIRPDGSSLLRAARDVGTPAPLDLRWVVWESGDEQ